MMTGRVQRLWEQISLLVPSPGPPARSRGPEGPYTSMFDNGDGDDDDHLDILFCVEILHIPVSMGSVKIIILDLLSNHCENTNSDFHSPNENDDGSDLSSSLGSIRAC